MSHVTFKVYARSTKTNSFGARRLILVSATGESWEVLKTEQFAPKWGDLVCVPARTDGYRGWAEAGFEVPRRLEDAPAKVLNTLWPTEHPSVPPPRSSENARRAKVAEKALRTCLEFKEDPRPALVDLLTNLRHWAKQAGEDYEACAATAARHFQIESEEED